MKTAGLLKKSILTGLFKNVRMQGGQKPGNETYFFVRRLTAPAGLFPPSAAMKRAKDMAQRRRRAFFNNPTALKIAALTAILVSFALAGHVSAESLGQKFAREICASVGDTYTLTNLDKFLWNGQIVEGDYSREESGVTITYNFRKWRREEYASCIRKEPRQNGEGVKCKKWDVHREGDIMKRYLASLFDCI